VSGNVSPASEKGRRRSKSHCRFCFKCPSRLARRGRDVEAYRVIALVKKGFADNFVISGGIRRNVGLVMKIEARLDGLKINLPVEPMIVGAVGAALFAIDRAKKGDGATTDEQAAAWRCPDRNSTWRSMAVQVENGVCALFSHRSTRRSDGLGPASSGFRHSLLLRSFAARVKLDASATIATATPVVGHACARVRAVVPLQRRNALAKALAPA
jgi:hypothetical protein